MLIGEGQAGKIEDFNFAYQAQQKNDEEHCIFEFEASDLPGNLSKTSRLG
ncbi:MAG: hypothetical protein PHW04_16560 [Candidatus Wallbacteria bacterium]|nr:hypothetical protein [Candidatus Wallbacteria bacterium]